MNRSYDALVDAGLFVVARYYDKDIEDVTIEDIRNSLDFFEDRWKKAKEIKCYSSLAFSLFQNSALTQKNMNLSDKCNKILDTLGEDEVCTVCGERHIDIAKYTSDEVDISKTFRSGLPSSKFYNFSNNLTFVNVCGVCLVLSLLSIFNTKMAGGQGIITISDNDEYMYDMTYKNWEEMDNNILSEVKEEKVKYTEAIKEIIKNAVSNNKIYEGYIKIIAYRNSARDESYTEYEVLNEELLLINTLLEKSLYDEANEKGIIMGIISGKIKRNYLKYVSKNNEIIVSKELLNIIERKYDKMDRKSSELIKEVAKGLTSDDMYKIQRMDKAYKLGDYITNLTIDGRLNVDGEQIDLFYNHMKFNLIKSKLMLSIIDNEKN